MLSALLDVWSSLLYPPPPIATSTRTIVDESRISYRKFYFYTWVEAYRVWHWCYTLHIDNDVNANKLFNKSRPVHHVQEMCIRLHCMVFIAHCTHARRAAWYDSSISFVQFHINCFNLNLISNTHVFDSIGPITMLSNQSRIDINFLDFNMPTGTVILAFQVRFSCFECRNRVLFQFEVL